MDFPATLDESPKYVYSTEELRQNVIVLLKNPLGSFCQGYAVGSAVSVHTLDNISLEESVRQTLSQIPYIKILNISVNVPNVVVNIEYNSEVIRFQYSIEL